MNLIDKWRAEAYELDWGQSELSGAERRERAAALRKCASELEAAAVKGYVGMKKDKIWKNAHGAIMIWPNQNAAKTGKEALLIVED